MHVLTFSVSFISQRTNLKHQNSSDLHRSRHGSSPELDDHTPDPLNYIPRDALNAVRATLGAHEMHLGGDSRERNVRRQIQHREPSRRSSSSCFPQNHRQGKQQHIRKPLESQRIFHQLISVLVCL